MVACFKLTYLSSTELQSQIPLRHWHTVVKDYPTMHYIVIPSHTQSMIAYIILVEQFWEFQFKLCIVGTSLASG